jgi:homoserine O-succinyltransferase
MNSAGSESRPGSDKWSVSRTDPTVVIGLVNNMPDAALRTTERQFRDLLAAASRDIVVQFRLFALPDVPRDAGQSYISQHCDDIQELWADGAVDGLIVTGTEPRAPDLRDEPYWRSLTRLIDWAEHHTISTVWSCLAAHAAVLHRDGIERRPLGEKLSGVFECSKASRHPIIAGLPAQWSTPHSRYNEVPEAALSAKGYEILARSADAGADLFVAGRRSLFLFVQGHPEYDAGALLREYRRDVARFLTGDRASYPEMPRGYFSPAATAAFEAFRGRALSSRNAVPIEHFPAAAAREDHLTSTWHDSAVGIYANWLRYIVEQKSRNHSARTSATSALKVTSVA